MDGWVVALVAALAGYLLGSIPAAYLVGRLAADIDVRTAGEGNVGARNTFHEVGHGWGAAVFVVDIGKGAAAALLFRDEPAWVLAAAACFVVVGHAFPVWLGFVGGKGMAAAGGVTIVLMPWATLIGGAVSAVVWLATRRFLPTVVSATVVAFLAAPFTGVRWGFVLVALAAFLLVAAKRIIDEPRMRRIEAESGWDRARGGSSR